MSLFLTVIMLASGQGLVPRVGIEQTHSTKWPSKGIGPKRRTTMRTKGIAVDQSASSRDGGFMPCARQALSCGEHRNRASDNAA